MCNMQRQSIIICGSKKTDIDLSYIIDKFGTIIRHNKAIPGYRYGERDSSIQILNCHVYDNYKQRKTAEELYEFYADMNIPLEYLKRYCEYIYNLDEKRIKTFNDNNTHLMLSMAEQYKLDIAYEMKNMRTELINNNPVHLRCGFSYIAECLRLGIIPWLIGYDISEHDRNNHNYNNTKRTGAHDIHLERRLLIELHVRGLIDASLCNIDSRGVFNEDISATNHSMEIWDDYVCRHR